MGILLTDLPSLAGLASHFICLLVSILLLCSPSPVVRCLAILLSLLQAYNRYQITDIWNGGLPCLEMKILNKVAKNKEVPITSKLNLSNLVTRSIYSTRDEGYC
ncbi:hypothetical protein F0562_036009 [Nyssa sinensis]|uniref:Uncharacterized protein n=1 Tax=Nyssa sinensis TaxID=561372 RepID=A0A5J5AEI0_9ASTE|nr:hypothetical protein F0562_036009 [Nyssa sinensis]